MAATRASTGCAACGRSNQIFVYHIPTARLLARLTDPQLSGGGSAAHRDLVNALSFSPDGGLIASGGYREVKLWRRPRNVRRFTVSLSSHAKVQSLATSGVRRT